MPDTGSVTRPHIHTRVYISGCSQNSIPYINRVQDTSTTRAFTTNFTETISRNLDPSPAVFRLGHCVNQKPRAGRCAPGRRGTTATSGHLRRNAARADRAPFYVLESAARRSYRTSELISSRQTQRRRAPGQNMRTYRHRARSETGLKARASRSHSFKFGAVKDDIFTTRSSALK